MKRRPPMASLSWAGLALLLLGVGCSRNAAGPTPTLESGLAAIPKTTDGAIAIGNLDSQVGGQEKRVENAPGDTTLRAGLVEMLISRGEIVGSIADYERATEIAEKLVQDAPNRPEAWTARASTNATWHRWEAALKDLDAAEKAGAKPASLKSARSSIFAATGRLDEAWAMAPSNGDRAGDSMALATRGLLEGEFGRLADAEGDLGAARARYRDVSPLPLAWMDASEAAMYEKQGDSAKARAYYTRAVRILPSFAKAAAHLAVHETATRAVEILEPVAKRSDDPEIDAELGDALIRSGRKEEGESRIQKARARYEDLLTRHPEAFADHGARFFLGAGKDPARALPLAKQNAANRPTDEALALWLDAAELSKNPQQACEAAKRLVALPHAAESFKTRALRASTRCF